MLTRVSRWRVLIGHRKRISSNLPSRSSRCQDWSRPEIVRVIAIEEPIATVAAISSSDIVIRQRLQVWMLGGFYVFRV